MDLKASDLSAQASISNSYAWEILNGKRTPSRPLAIHIYQATGWKHKSIASLSVDQIDLLATLDPWTPVADRAA